MAQICLLSTFIAILPSSIHLLFRPTKQNFLLALINSSFAFFLFSFQVHEKTILLVALPVILYFPFDPLLSLWFLQISTFSMFPLIIKDNLLIPFIGLSGIYFISLKILLRYSGLRYKNVKDLKLKNFLKNLFNLSMIGEILLIVGFLFVKPPENLPFLFPFLVSAYSCIHFVIFFLYFNCVQIFTVKEKEKMK